MEGAPAFDRHGRIHFQASRQLGLTCNLQPGYATSTFGVLAVHAHLSLIFICSSRALSGHTTCYPRNQYDGLDHTFESFKHSQM